MLRLRPRCMCEHTSSSRHTRSSHARLVPGFGVLLGLVWLIRDLATVSKRRLRRRLGRVTVKFAFHARSRILRSLRGAVLHERPGISRGKYGINGPNSFCRRKPISYTSSVGYICMELIGCRSEVFVFCTAISERRCRFRILMSYVTYLHDYDVCSLLISSELTRKS